MSSNRFRNHQRWLFCVTCVSALMIGLVDEDRFGGFVRADEAVPTKVAEMPLENASEEKGGKKITPDQFHVVDDTVKWTIFLVAVSGLGTVVVLTLIIVGARRMRRLTRSGLLKSKYDELELLREKYRREVEGLDTPPPPSREKYR